jgi:hypothetical protein
VVMDFEQLRNDLLENQNDHSTDIERGCIVVVNDERHVRYHVAY